MINPMREEMMAKLPEPLTGLIGQAIAFHGGGWSHTRGENKEEFSNPRSRVVMELLAEGYSTGSIAELLFLSTRTMESHVSRMMVYHGCNNRTHLVAKYLKTKFYEKSKEDSAAPALCVDDPNG